MRNTHMIRTRWAAVGAATAITLGAVGIGGLNIASAGVSSGERPVFIPIDPCRLVDTRAAAAVGPKTSPLGARDTHTVVAHGANGECTGTSAIPTDAVGLALNVTAVGPTENTFLTFWGDGVNPGTSNLNPRAGAAPTPNSVNTPLSDTGSFNVYNEAGSVNVIVDVNGYYADHDHDDRYYTEAEADARFSTPAQIDEALQVDRHVLGGADFDTVNGETGWRFNAIWFKSGANQECIIAPFDAAVGQTVSEVSLRYATTTGATVGVSVYGTAGVVGPVTTESIHIMSDEEKDVPATPSGTIVETSFALRADLTVREEYHYIMAICTADSISVASGVVEFG